MAGPKPRRSRSPIFSGYWKSRSTFCAACAVFPERIAITQREYGIANDFHRVNVDTLWQDRFDEQPELQRQWERLFVHYRDSLRRR